MSMHSPSMVSDVLLEGSIDALDAEAGRLVLTAPANLELTEGSGAAELEPLLHATSAAALSDRQSHELHAHDVWAFALPFVLDGGGTGALAVARRERSFRTDEQALMLRLVERAQRAVSEILAHEALREQALTDPLTRLGNRRKLTDDLVRLLTSDASAPTLLMLFDLNGFKSYNDTFGHVAGDVLLARLAHKLAYTVGSDGTVYRLGGDEFCVLLPADRDQLQEAVAAAAGALEERGERFAVTASCGTVLLPHEARTVEYGLQLADERMYARKRGRQVGPRGQAHDVLLHIMRAKQPLATDYLDGVSHRAVAVGRRMGMTGEQLDQLARAAALHDIGTVGLPDTILTKPGPLDPEEWSFVRQHTLLGERILNAAPALRPVATIVRATHERWDGHGYPDGLRAEQIPLAARIVAVCDAYQAMTATRCYRPTHSPESAQAELRSEAGRQFDPAVIDAFLQELTGPTAPSSTDHNTSRAEARAALAHEVVSHVNELLHEGRSYAA